MSDNNNQNNAPIESIGVTVRDNAGQRNIVTIKDMQPKLPEGILSTAHNKLGGIVNEITEDTLINVGKIEMRVKSALEQGLLIIDENGNIREPSANEKQAIQKQNEEAAKAERSKTHFLPEEEPRSTKFVNDFSGTLREFGNPQAEIARFLMTNTLPESMVKAMNKTGMTEQVFRDKVNNVIQDFRGMVHGLFKSAGIPEEQWEDVWDFEEETMSQHKSVAACMNLLETGDKRYFLDLIQRYKGVRPTSQKK